MTDTIARDLQRLNEDMAAKEDEGAAAKPFFEALLSDPLVFRRTTGKAVGKFATKGS
jgi:hypothetical protein